MLEMLKRNLEYYQGKIEANDFDEIDNLRLLADYKKLIQVRLSINELIKSYEMFLDII